MHLEKIDRKIVDFIEKEKYDDLISFLKTENVEVVPNF